MNPDPSIFRTISQDPGPRNPLRRSVLRWAGAAAAAGIAARFFGRGSELRAGEAAAAEPIANDAWKLPRDKPLPKVTKTEAEWKKLLTAEQFYVTRQQGTERAYTGATWNNHDKGVYRCVCCGLDLFSSATKFESGTGWPSFWQPIAPDRIGSETDRTLFMVRTEVHCARCEGHLGHVFDDGPPPTGLRYCMNSASLRFEAA